MVRETQHSISFTLDKGRTQRIPSFSLFVKVRVTIRLNDQPSFVTDDVAEIGTKALLAAEFVAVELGAAEDRSKSLFGGRRVLAPFSRLLDGAVACV